MKILFLFSHLSMLLIINLSFDITLAHCLFYIPVAPVAKHILPDHPVYNGSRAEETGPDRDL